MSIVSRTIIITLLVWLVLVVGGVLLQIFLSRRESRWPGLVLPGITFLWSFVYLFSIAYAGESFLAMVGLILGTFLYTNIPTIILLAIYFACRGKKKKERMLEKMNIRDLE